MLTKYLRYWWIINLNYYEIWYITIFLGTGLENTILTCITLILKTFDVVKKLFSSFYYNTFYMIHVIKGKKNSWLCYFYSVLLFMLKNNAAVFTYTCRKILVQDTLVLLKNLRNRIHIQWEKNTFLYEKDPTKSYPCLLLCMPTSSTIQAY